MTDCVRRLLDHVRQAPHAELREFVFITTAACAAERSGVEWSGAFLKPGAAFNLLHGGTYEA